MNYSYTLCNPRLSKIINIVQSFLSSEQENKYEITLSGSNLDFHLQYDDYAVDFNQVFFNIANTNNIISSDKRGKKTRKYY